MRSQKSRRSLLESGRGLLFPQQMATSPANPLFLLQQSDSGVGRLAWLESTSMAKSPANPIFFQQFSLLEYHILQRAQTLSHYFCKPTHYTRQFNTYVLINFQKQRYRNHVWLLPQLLLQHKACRLCLYFQFLFAEILI